MLQIIQKSTIILLLALSTLGGMQAQDLKIGYANIELILAYLPETRTMNQSLSTYEQKQVEQLQAKQRYAQTVYDDAVTIAQGENPDENVLKTKEAELQKLQAEIQKFQQDSQQRLITKRQDLLEPIITKIQKQIEAVAAAQNYTYIMNTVDGSGVSIILHGPEEHDLTKTIMKGLGIDVAKLEGEGGN